MKRLKPNGKSMAKLTALWRACGLIGRLQPRILPLAVMKSALAAFTPFVGIYLSALILDELAGACDPARIMLYVGLILGLNLLLALTRGALGRLTEAMHDRLYYLLRFEMNYLLFDTDYENLENPEIYVRKQKIDEALNMGSRGVWGVVYGLESLVTNLVAVTAAFALAIPLFTAGAGAPGASAFSSPWLSALLAALVVASSAFSAMSNTRLGKRLFERFDGFMPLNRRFFYMSQAADDVKYGKDMRVYRQWGLMSKVFDALRRETIKLSDDIGRLTGRYNGINAAISSILGGAVYLFVGLKALAGIISVGAIIKYVGAISQFITAFSGLISSATDFWMNADYVRLYIDFLDTPNPKYQGTLPVEKRGDNEYEFEFRDVSFRYPGTEPWALKNLSLKLNVGERLAVVGMNGSGKTTMIKLLCRLYDPQEGAILLNGIDIRLYDYREYLGLFSVVFQDFKLFSFPLGQNVAASMDYDRGKAEECLREAGMEDLARTLPKGLDTPLYKVDADGVEISGGEAQKAALARALYKGAPFVVLDEPTAALDPIAEYDIYTRFDSIVGGRTAVYISHRLSSCRFCDDIAVFHEGRIVQRGSHEELLKDETGKYYELWNAQAQYYREEPSAEMSDAS